MDCPSSFWINRLVYQIRQEVADMSEKTRAIVAKNSQRARYAIVGVRWNEAIPEFVITYGDQESLREVISARSIIGIGFSFRKAAVAVVGNSSSRDADSKNTREKTSFVREDDCRAAQSPRQRLRHSVGLKDIRRIAYAALRHAIAAGILMFYSKSVMGAALRAFVGA